MKSVFVSLLLVLPLLCQAKEKPKYIINEIPKDLSQNANAVYWIDKSSVQIVARNKATHKVLRAVTILNANAVDHASVVVYYDRHSRISFLRGTIYNANGEVIRRTKANEIYDQSAIDGSLFSDNRLKHINLKHGSYPYTIEYEYEIEYKYLFYLPSYEQYEAEKVSVISSEYTVTYPRDLKPRFKATLIETKPIAVDLGNNIESLTWTFQNLKPITTEPYGPFWRNVVPNIITSPSLFEYDGYAGKMDTWDDIGRWIQLINKGRNTLPEATKNKVLSLTKDLRTPEEKVKTLYEYMQNKTRYVSVQLGIGGYQPFEASVVDQNGYGDCKALSNYMVSMLDLVGIKSNYVLVKSQYPPRKLDPAFPSLQFDHAIVCVPLEKDTIWLECTTQTGPFGYMGTHTGNRKALAITEHGAKIVSTPVYTEKENLQIRTANVMVYEDGHARATVKTRYSGLQYENSNLDNYLGGTHENQKKWVLNNTNIPSFDIDKFSFENHKSRIPTAVLNLDLSLNRFATVSGKRMFLTPNIMNRSTFIPEKVENRKTNVVLNLGYTDIDTINFSISEKIYPEFLPEPVKIESRFGAYEASFLLEQGKVVYVRRMIRRQGEFPADSYPELIEFYKAINRADNIKLVFLTKT